MAGKIFVELPGSVVIVSTDKYFSEQDGDKDR
jgi:hypothetical protein